MIEPTVLPETQVRALTPRQRMVVHLTTGIANDLDRGTVAEQHTAALLRLCADAVSHGYEPGLVVAGRAWRAAQEAKEPTP